MSAAGVGGCERRGYGEGKRRMDSGIFLPDSGPAESRLSIFNAIMSRQV